MGLHAWGDVSDVMLSPPSVKTKQLTQDQTNLCKVSYPILYGLQGRNSSCDLKRRPSSRKRVSPSLKVRRTQSKGA